VNILIDIAHPAHVHLVRNTYFELIKRGHKVYVTVKYIPCAIALLENYKIPYIYLGGKKDSLSGKLFWQILYNLQVWWIVLSKNIKLGFGTSITLAQISKLSGLHSIILDDDDDEVEPLFVKYCHPYADVVLSPLGAIRASKKTVTYEGYHELAYLHPGRFTPDVTVLDEIGLKEKEAYFILRFNAFKAHHDIGEEGLSVENKRRLIALLEKRGRVFITTEREIEKEFENYQLSLSPEKIHSLISFATMLVGDSQTMTSEAAVLGVPSIRCNTFVGKISYLEEEEHKYGLTFGFHPADSEAMFLKIEELLEIPDLKTKWQVKRQSLLRAKIDVTAFYVWFIENYPASAKIMKETSKNDCVFK